MAASTTAFTCGSWGDDSTLKDGAFVEGFLDVHQAVRVLTQSLSEPYRPKQSKTCHTAWKDQKTHIKIRLGGFWWFMHVYAYRIGENTRHVCFMPILGDSDLLKDLDVVYKSRPTETAKHTAENCSSAFPSVQLLSNPPVRPKDPRCARLGVSMAHPQDHLPGWKDTVENPRGGGPLPGEQPKRLPSLRHAALGFECEAAKALGSISLKDLKVQTERKTVLKGSAFSCIARCNILLVFNGSSATPWWMDDWLS